MVFSEIVKTTNADIFKLATRDMDECFSAAEIATKIQFYIDRNGATDAVTVAESQSFYGTNPKYSHKQYSRKKPGSSTQQTNIGPNHTKGKTNNGFNNASKGRNESNKRGPRSSGWIEPCKFQNQPQGCMKQNCKFYHYKKTNGAYHMAHTNQDGTKNQNKINHQTDNRIENGNRIENNDDDSIQGLATTLYNSTVNDPDFQNS